MPMSERSEKLFSALGEVRDELVDEAAGTQNLKQKKKPWMRYAGMAAALALAVGLGAALIPRMGSGQEAAPSTPGTNAGGSGSDGASEFMSYAGPVFPLTLAEQNEAITAQRDLTLDFAPWVPVWISNGEMLEEARGCGATEAELAEHAADLERWYPEGGYYDKGTDLLVNDAYVLTNSTDSEQVVEMLYPFVSDLANLRAKQPTMTVEGEVRLAEVIPGGYAGGFRGAGGENDGRLNLDQPTNWEDYKALLSDGAYLAEALEAGMDLRGEQVVVYQFTDAWGPEESEDIPNPSIRVSFDLDYEKTTVLSYGFHSGSYDPDSGWMGKGFSIPKDFRWDRHHPKYLVVVGEDVENMETSFYATGGWDREKEVEGGVTIDRYETDLDSALREIAALMFETDLHWGYGSLCEADFEMYYTLLCDWLTTYGKLSDDVVERYGYGRLDESDFATVDRVFYLRAEVTIPAGESVKVTAALNKKASFDYACTGSENVGVSGYDAVTALGSVLSFTAQRARLEDRGQIAIVRENFGFDLENAVTEVELDLAVEHYYLEVRRLET